MSDGSRASIRMRDPQLRFIVAFAVAGLTLLAVLLVIGRGLDAKTIDERVGTTESSLGLVEEGELCGPDGILLPARAGYDGFTMLCWDAGDGLNRWHVDPRQLTTLT